MNPTPELEEFPDEAEWLEALLDQAEASGELTEFTHERWDALEREALARVQRKIR